MKSRYRKEGHRSRPSGGRKKKKAKSPYNVDKEFGFKSGIDGIVDRPLKDRITYPVELKYVMQLQANVAGQISTRFSLRNITRAMGGTGTYDNVLNYAAVFDEYRPTQFRMRYFPTGPLTNGLPAAFTAVDFDDLDQTNPATLNAVLDYNNMKVFDPRYPSEEVLKIPVLMAGTQVGLVSNTPASVHEGGFFDFASPPYDGVMYFYVQSLAPNQILGEVILTMRILMRRNR